MSRPFIEIIACRCDPGWAESPDEPDTTAMVRQRSAGVSATDMYLDWCRFIIQKFTWFTWWMTSVAQTSWRCLTSDLNSCLLALAGMTLFVTLTSLSLFSFSDATLFQSIDDHHDIVQNFLYWGNPWVVSNRLCINCRHFHLFIFSTS